VGYYEANVSIGTPVYYLPPGRRLTARIAC
jgi:hypothetical protein